jgi:hypothetical protein
MLEVTAYTGLGAGVHSVAVTDCKVMPAKAGGTYLRWEFADHTGRTASANSSVEMTPGNKTGKWFAALTGKPTEVGQSRALTEVIGRPGTIVIEINPEGYPKVIALTAREAAPKAHKPVIETVAAAEALPDELPF